MTRGTRQGTITVDGQRATISVERWLPYPITSLRRMSGRILVWDPPHVLEHEWKQSNIGDTVARYELCEEEGGTLLRFRHRGMRVPEARGYIPGQHAYLDRLEARLGGQHLPSWMARYDEVQGLYGKWQGPPDAEPNEGAAR